RRASTLPPAPDAADPGFRIRVFRQAELLRLGTNPQGTYVGSKWGRNLRTIDVMYELQRDHGDRFCALDTMADVRRGVTTNCDDFFIVTDITDEVLGRDLTAADFLSLYGVR